MRRVWLPRWLPVRPWNRPVRSYVSGAVEVSTEPTLVCAVGQFVEQCLLRNTGDVVVYVGGPTVAADGGFPLDPGERIELKSYQDDSIEVWAVVEKDDGTLVFLVSS